MSNTNNENRTLKKAKKARVIPGFGLTMGVTVTIWADHRMGTCKI